MRNGLTHTAISAAALVLAAGAAIAAPEIVVDQALGNASNGTTLNFRSDGSGVDGGNSDLYNRRGDGGLNGPYGTDEYVVSFTLTEPLFIQVTMNQTTVTGPGNPTDVRTWLLGRLDVDIANLTVGNFPFTTAIDGLFNNQVGGIDGDQYGFGPYPPGTYYISVDPFTGPIAGQTFGDGDVDADFTVTFSTASTADVLGNPSLTGLQIDQNLGALPAGSFNLTGTTVGQANDVVGYRDGVGGAFFGFLEDLGEFTYQFSTSSTQSFGIVNNEGVFIGSDQDHYLCDGTAVTTGFDLFGDGSTLGTVADDAIAFIDEDGNLGIFDAGTYFLAVESFDFPAADGIEGPYDINLTLTNTAVCGTNAFNVDELAGNQFDGGSIFFGDDLSFVGASNVCYYRNTATGIAPNFTNEFNEYVIQFGTTEPLLFSLANLEGAGTGVDTDQWLLDGLTVTTGVSLLGLANAAGAPSGTAAEDTVGLVDEEGIFGVQPAGVYWLAIDGFDANGFASVTLDFAAVQTLPDTIDVAAEAAGNDLGTVAAAFEAVDFSACALTATDQDTIVGIWDAASGDLLFTGDDGCDTGNSFATEIENMVFAEGDYVLSISGIQAGAFGDGLFHNVAFTEAPVSGGFSLGANVVRGTTATANFNVPAFQRQVFTFSIGPGSLAFPTATDLGTIVPGEDLDLDFNFCASDYDAEVGVWDDLGLLIGVFDDSNLCPGYQPAFLLDLDADGDGNVAGDLVGQQFYIGVGGFNNEFSSGFTSIVDPDDADGQTRTGNISFTIEEGAPVTAPSVSNNLVFWVFTVGSPDPVFPGCNAADLAADFGVLNVNDIIDFVNGFNSQNPIADISPLDGIFPGGDGAFNVNDIIDFVNSFNAGCP